LILSGFFGGLTISVILKWVVPDSTWKDILIISGGWSMAMLLGFIFSPYLFPYLDSGWDYSTSINCFFIGFFAGALGSWIMYWKIGVNITSDDEDIPTH
jgi:hypothetical protein